MPLRFTLRQLEYFVAVGEAGSIAQAAAAVNVSSPSISAAIAQLETEFGIQLFVRRQSHALALTAGGRTFFKAARSLLRDADALHDLAGDIGGQVRGPLDLGCLATFAQIVLPDLRRRFEARYPEVRIRQHEGHQGALVAMLQRGEIDAALTYDLALAQDVSFEPLVELSPYVLLPAGHPLAARPALAPADLADEPMVLLDLPVSRDYFLALFQQRGLRPRIAERTGDMAVMRSLVGNGFGYGLANMPPVHAFAPDGKPLAFVPLGDGIRSLALGVATARAEHQTRTVRAFVELCHVSGVLPPQPHRD